MIKSTILTRLQSSLINPHRPNRTATARLEAIARVCAEVLEERRLMSFSPAVNYAASDYPVDVVTADFNNDGRLDMAATNAGTTRIGVLLGNGNGTFQAPLTPDAGGTTQSVAVGDFNEDGKLDLAVATSASVNVMLGNGDGTFQAPSHIGIEGDVASVAVGDFNADGTLDLGVTSHTYTVSYPYGWYEAHLNVLLGNGDGSFAAPNTQLFAGAIPSKGVVADLNGDGIDDFAVADSQYWAISILFGDATGQFQNTSTVGLISPPGRLAAGDMDGDGDNDLVVSRGPWYGTDVGVLPGDGAGGFGPASYYAGVSGNSVALGDFDHDAQLDVAIANGANNVTVLRRRGDGSFGPAELFNAGPGVNTVTSGDLSGDGWLDLATANASANSVSVLMNDRAWSPAPPSLTINDVTITEGNSGTVAAVFTVTRSGNLAGVATVNYSTANGGALAGSDYVAKSGTLTFASGVATMQVTVAVNGDVTDEWDQYFYVNLSAASGAVITDNQGSGLIVDNDAAPTITITPKVSAKEGNKNGTPTFGFNVTLSTASEKTITVNFGTADGSATTANRDYVATSGTLSFAAGTISKSIVVRVIGDNDKEADEMFLVNLSLITNASVLNTQGVGEIVNDDKH